MKCWTRSISFQVSFWLGYFKSMFKTCKYVTSCTANRQFSQLSESVSFMRPKGFVDCELWLFSLTLGHWLKLSQQKAIHVDVTYGSKHWFLHELVTYALCDPRSHKRHMCYVLLSLRRAVTNTGNSSKFLPQCHVAMRSDTAGGCLSVSWELGTYAPAWIIEITFHCSY